MMGNDVPTPGGLPPGPPWPLDLLADLHADVLEPGVAEELRRHVESDPDAMDALAALDATRRDLASLPAPRIPDDVAVRLDAAIAAEAASAARLAPPGPFPPPGPVPARPLATAQPSAARPGPGSAHPGAVPAPSAPVDLDAVRRRRRGLIAGGGVLTAAAAVAVVAMFNLLGPKTGGEPHASAPTSNTGIAPLTLTAAELNDALGDVLGTRDYGALAGPARLDACLSAIGVSGAEPVGVRPVILDGRQGVLVVLPAGNNPPRWRLLVVGPECGPGRPEKLAETTTG